MRNIILKPWTKVCALSLALAAGQTQAQTVTTIGGGNSSAPFAGYQDGHTLQAHFNQPLGLALDPDNHYMFVADYNNNVVRLITTPGITASSSTSTFTNGFYPNVTKGISHPVSVIVDLATNVFVLNQGNRTNGTLLEYNAFYPGYPTLVATNASLLTYPTAMAVDTSFNNLYLAVASNTVLHVALSNNTVSVVGVITSPGVRLEGIAVLDNGQLALSDAGTNSGIWLMNPATGATTPLAGFHGRGDNSDNWPVPAADAIFNQPGNIAKAGNGILVIADQGNNRVKLLDTTSGTVTLLYGVSTSKWGNPPYPGWVDGPSGIVTGDAESRLPFGMVVASDGSVFASEDYYDVLRHVTSTGLVGPPAPPPPPPGAPQNLQATATYGQVNLTWSPVTGATNYNVKHSLSSGGPFETIGTTSATSFTDYELNGSTNYYVVSAIGAGGEGPNSSEVMAVVPTPPPAAPVIGWFDYETIFLLSVLHPVTSATFNNDVLLAIEGTNGSATYYTTDGSNPSKTNGFTPPPYHDGLSINQNQPLPATTVPDLVIKAINVDSLHQVSPITTAEFFFQVANPTITGNNADQFVVSDITTNALLYYTLDGSDPTNGPPSVGPITLNGTNNSVQLSLVITNNTLFKVRGFRNGYSPSGTAEQLFSTSNFVANIISFGFASGEASSDFVASPGQIFYAPVTMSPLSGVSIYSLQFNLTATNAGPNPGPAIPPGAFTFSSMLLKPDPSRPGLYLTIPPYMFAYANTATTTSNQYVNYEGTNFVNLETTNSALNLLGVGWVERFSETNLYNTRAQDLILYSQAHDDLFSQAGGQIIVGGFAFQVPTNAVTNQTYQIQIGRPTATSDGIGAPGSDVYIAAPTNGSTAGGSPINALKYVTVGQRKYIAGSVYPFRWFNAGDFGSSAIVNADVEQVFQSAIYQLNYPLGGSDFFDGMDSCGSLGYLDSNPADSNYGYYTNSGVAATTAALFSGNDTTINQVVFGDGTLDVCDVYVTFRRSLDPSLTWFRRFWNNGQRVADTIPNVANHLVQSGSSGTSTSPKPKALNTSTAPQVNFAAGDVIGTAGQTVTVPINATILGSYPLRVLMLNLSVVPLDGSPVLASAVSFNQTATTLGTPYTTASDANGNFAAVWLNSTNSGLTGTATLGTLSVTIPSTASSTAAYAIHFDHASASPNGLASFPNQKLTGLLTTTARTDSYFSDGIPDSWRLRWFGTIYNVLSASNACPSGDGVPNWKKYIAGVDPNIPNDFPSVNAKTPVPSGSTSAIHWPSVAGKQYVITRSASLFGTPWTVLSTNTGTGGDMEFDDNSTVPTKFYRVEILP